MKEGRQWSEMIEDVDKFWEKFKNGQDFYGPHKGSTLEMAILKMKILQRWHKENPQGDDRRHRYLDLPKIGLDIDEVLAAWTDAWQERHGIKGEVIFWNFDREINKRFEQMKDDKEFWMNIKAKITPDQLPFEPHCYITARSIPQEWTEEWLYEVMGFPHVPVYSVGFGQSKVAVARRSGVDLFVDDSFKNFVELNNGGICTFLWDTPQNRKYDVGYKRLYDLNDLVS